MAGVSIDARDTIDSAKKEKIVDWLEENNINSNEAYQVIITTEDNGYEVEVRRYAVNDEGKHYLDESGEDIAKEEPIIIYTDSLPEFVRSDI